MKKQMKETGNKEEDKEKGKQEVDADYFDFITGACNRLRY